MKKTVPFAALIVAVVAALVGCGDSDQSRPPQATPLEPNHPPVVNKVWTKADKIAAVEKAPIPDEQKKSEIAKINAGP